MPGCPRCKAAIDCTGYRYEMDQESQRIGGQVEGSGYRAEMDNIIPLIAANVYDEEALEALAQTQGLQEGLWKDYLVNDRGDVDAFNSIQVEQRLLWDDWRAEYGFPDDDDDD